MLPATGIIKASMVNEELGKSLKAVFSINDPKVRLLGNKPSGRIAFSDLRGRSYGKQIVSLSVEMRYNNGEGTYSSRIGIKEIQIFDADDRNITKHMTWTQMITDSNKSNQIIGSAQSAIDGSLETEYYGENKSSGDANLGLKVTTTSGIVYAKRVKVIFGLFKYSTDHDGSNVWIHINGEEVYHFYHKRGSPGPQPSFEIIF